MTVRHSQGSYEIEECTLDHALASLPEDSQIVTDTNLSAIYGDALRPFRVHEVPPGEPSKSVAVWSRLQSQLVQSRASRRTTIVAFGGGVVGDLAGFVAATYMRGAPLIQIPTSLLAQVDSSVGGKVGIDLPEGKNLVGAFYPPTRLYLCDETLDTLPEREYRNGMAEVWKYGFILDPEFVQALRAKALSRSATVRRCIESKRRVVEADEFETTGERAKLNFGHTVGHAIEKLTGYGPVLHGEAIAIGMVVEAAISEALELCPRGVREVVEECLRAEGLPTTSIVLSNSDMLIEAMQSDKKARDGRLAFSLLESIGSCRLVEDVSVDIVRSVLSEQ